MRFCSGSRRLLGAVRPGDAVQPSVGGLELDKQHRHQLRPPCRQSGGRAPARGGRGRGGPQQGHQQLSQRTGLEWQRHWDKQPSAWSLTSSKSNCTCESASGLHNQRVVVFVLCWFSSALQPGMLCDPWVRVLLWKTGYLFGPNTLAINMRFDRMLENQPPPSFFK